MDALRKAYQRAICIPVNNVEAIWQEYNQFENNLNKMTVSSFNLFLPLPFLLFRILPVCLLDPCPFLPLAGIRNDLLGLYSHFNERASRQLRMQMATREPSTMQSRLQPHKSEIESRADRGRDTA